MLHPHLFDGLLDFTQGIWRAPGVSCHPDTFSSHSVFSIFKDKTIVVLVLISSLAHVDALLRETLWAQTWQYLRLHPYLFLIGRPLPLTTMELYPNRYGLMWDFRPESLITRCDLSSPMNMVVRVFPPLALMCTSRYTLEGRVKIVVPTVLHICLWFV